MVFSQESSQAILEMGNVEVIALKTSRIQCPSCLHYVFKGTILCACGKHVRPDQEMIRRIKAAFEILRAPSFPTSVVTARGYKHGPNLWQEHHNGKDALRGTKKGGRKFTSIWDGWQNDETYRESQLAIGWSDACVSWTILHKLISPIMRRKNKEVDATICFVYEVSTKIDRHRFYHKDQGTNKQRTH